MAIFTDVLLDVTKNGRKLPTNEYKEFGLHPIIDQGQNDIAGYTDETSGLFSDVPAIIFGDHTRVIKYVDAPFFIGADGVKILKAKDNKANYKFLYYALSSAKIPNTGYNRHFKWLKEIDIPTYSEQEQSQIVSELDKVTALIGLRKEQLDKLDEIVKSRFVELFGDCNKQTSIKESGLTISDGNYSSKYPRSEEFVESGIPFIRANNLKNGTVIDEDMYYITPEKHKILLKGHLKPNDVLITTRGNIGQVAIVPEKHNDSNINAQIVLLRDENGRFIPHYLLWALQTEEAKVQYLELQTGTALKQLPVGRLEQVKIKEPPIKQQEQFAAFVEQTDKSKLAVQQSLEKLETLKKSLMQKYFG